jgi:NAD(P)H-dependent FMN reductase
MTTILGISGSLRRGSYNTALLTAAQQEAVPGVVVEAASIRGIPIYDGDLEAEGIPHEVAALKERVVQADGLLLVTPEYNNSMPGALKNAIDWLSRPPSDLPRIFHALPVAIIGASPGAFGTAHAQSAWLPVLRTLRTQPWFGGRLMVSRAKDVFNETGQLVDDDVRERLREFLQGFARFIETCGRSGRGEPG